MLVIIRFGFCNAADSAGVDENVLIRAGREEEFRPHMGAFAAIDNVNTAADAFDENGTFTATECLLAVFFF